MGKERCKRTVKYRRISSFLKGFIPVACIGGVIAVAFVFARDLHEEKESVQFIMPEENRQIVISLGEKPSTIYISWKGNSRQAEYIRVTEDKSDLPKAEWIKADVKKTLGGRYYRNSVALNSLDAGKTYYYEIGDEAAFDTFGSFAAPDEDGETKFLYLGDIQFDESLTDYVRWGILTEEIYERNSDLDFAVIGGDMINSPSRDEEWNAFFNNSSVFSVLPLMTAAGNHEGVSSNNTFRKMFAAAANGPDGDNIRQTFYYFDYGQCRIVVTDSSFLTQQRREKLGEEKWKAYESLVEEWLASVLSDSGSRWNIVVTHHPPYGMHDFKSVSEELRQYWVPIMEKNGVDIVLCGHQHLYMRTERINGIVYVMGNSGQRRSSYYNEYNAPDYSRMVYNEGPNYQIIRASEDELEITSYNEEGLIIDETLLRKPLKLPYFRIF